MLLRAGLLAAALIASAGSARAGTWIRLIRNAPIPVNLMLLLPDGTVMAARANISNQWYRLTPDVHGSYVNGTWSPMPSMHDTRLYYSSYVLRDGRVFVAGGEYGTGGGKAEVFDPTTNVWTQLTIPTTVLNPAATSPVTGDLQAFDDSMAEILPNGNVLIAPVEPRTFGQTVLFNPTTNTFSNGPTLFRGGSQTEASWVKLPDNTLLTVDPFGVNCERYNPVTNTWINDSNCTVALYDSVVGELGAGLMLNTGQAFFLGGTGHTAKYTPSGTTAPGIWTPTADIPNSLATPDAPAAMLVTGNCFCAVGPAVYFDNNLNDYVYPAPTSFYEYDPAANAFTAQPAPVGTSDNIPPYATNMLVLPDGNVLYAHASFDVYSYHPTGTVWPVKPVLATVTQNADGTYHLSGTGFNGLSAGAGYGDDAQMNSNYPIVRLSDGGTNVYYARTFNWSSTSVQTGAQVITTECKLPGTLPPGQYSMVVVANGIPSDAVCPGVSVASNPTPQNVCAGMPASFSITASGAISPTYRWRKGATTLVNGGNISGADTPNLTISPTTAADADASYTCIVGNGCSFAVSAAASLTVATPLNITTQPADVYLCQTGPATFTVAASGGPTFQWRRNQNPIQGATSATYFIPAVGTMQAGSYDCILTNACGSTTSNAATLRYCAIDYNCLSGVSVGDIFSFLTDWFDGQSKADWNANGVLETQDIFDFLNAWFAGC